MDVKGQSGSWGVLRLCGEGSVKCSLGPAAESSACEVKGGVAIAVPLVTWNGALVLVSPVYCSERQLQCCLYICCSWRLYVTVYMWAIPGQCQQVDIQPIKDSRQCLQRIGPI